MHNVYTTNWISRIPSLSIIAVCAISLFSGPAVLAQSDYFRGKHLTLIVPAGAGGSYDRYARLLAAHLPRHIPGRPIINVQPMPGAGGTKAASYLFNVATKDGFAVGLIHRRAIAAPLLIPRKFRYDAQKFLWLGSLVGRDVDVVKPASGRSGANENIKALNVLTLYMTVGYPLAVPPGVPRKMLEILRKAVSNMMGDDQFRRDAQKRNLPIRFLDHNRTLAAINKVYSLPRETIKKARRIYAEEGEPSCDRCTSDDAQTKACPQEKLKTLAQNSGGEVDCGCEGSDDISRMACPQSRLRFHRSRRKY